MRPYVVLRYIGLMLLLNAAFMFISMLIAIGNGMDTGFYPLLLSFILTATLGFFPTIFVPGGDALNNKEGYGVVVGSWLMACLVGMVPYALWGGEFNLINCWFESVSGFTTTGASILNDVEALPTSMLFWRSATHWLGGVGVVMLALIVLPSIGNTKKKLSNAELSPMAKDNYQYGTQKILQILILVYVGLTLTETLLLKIAGMTWFDALTASFSTIATGGFSNKNTSIAFYDSIWIEGIIALFMVIASLHFGLIFATITRKKNNIFRSEVVRYYILFLLGGGLIISLNLWLSDMYPSFWTAMRYGFFQLISVSSTTGYATADSSVWTPLAILILMIGTLQCACAGSTAGGIKCDRVLLSFKAVRATLTRQQHPNAIIRIKMNGVLQESSAVNMAVLYIFCYLVVLVLGTMLVTLFGSDLITSFSLSFTCMANAGPGFGEIGSMNNYSGLPSAVKFIATIIMLLGRLEIFGFIHLFSIHR